MKIQKTIIAIFGMLLAIALGFLAAKGSIALMAAAIVPLVLFFIKFSLGKKLSTEAILCFLLLAGLLIGQKGFTYLRFSPILFISEVFLAILACLYLFNVLVYRRSLIPNTWLAKIILLYLIYSAIHLYFDYQKYQLMALRDAGLAYYTLFFMLAYRIGEEKGALQVLKKWLPVLFLIVAINYAFYMIFPAFQEALLSIQVAGNPVFALAIDVCMNVAFGALFYFYGRLVMDNSRSTPWIWIGTFLSSLAILAVVRGTMVVTTIVSLGLLIYFYRKNVVKHALIFAGVIIIVITTFILVSPTKISEDMPTPIKGIMEELNAMQFGFNRDIKAETVADDTAQWRLMWWQFLIDDTMAHAPLTGGGFGLDISSPFLMVYHGVYVPDEEWERVRGAHSALMTIFARLGLIGVLFFTVIMGGIAHRIWISLRLLKQGELPSWYLAPVGYVVGGFVVSFFQYTWESPYTAIPFWIMVGVLYAGSDHVLRSKKDIAALELPHEESTSMIPPRFQPGLKESKGTFSRYYP